MNAPENTTKKLSMPIPDDCSERYAEGWANADLWLTNHPGDVGADAPGHWHEEKVNGFWDRLSAEREKLGK